MDCYIGLNAGVHGYEENIEYLSRLLEKKWDESASFRLPFYVDYEKNIILNSLK